ncbi:MAG: trypsin-like peptidase domain-containing protein, partial [Acidaminobacteraceae bacterium]
MSDEQNFNERTNEFVKSEKKQKKGWARFIVAILILSLVGGSASGVSYYMLEKYFNQDESSIKIESNTAFDNGTEKSIVDIAEEVGGSIVGITTKISYRDWLNNLRTVEGAGSGIIFKIDTQFVYILTNNHVVDDADELLVEFNEDMLVEATVVGSDADTDIGIIKVALKNIDSGSAGELKA